MEFVPAPIMITTTGSIFYSRPVQVSEEVNQLSATIQLSQAQDSEVMFSIAVQPQTSDDGENWVNLGGPENFTSYGVHLVNFVDLKGEFLRFQITGSEDEEAITVVRSLDVYLSAQ